MIIHYLSTGVEALTATSQFVRRSDCFHEMFHFLTFGILLRTRKTEQPGQVSSCRRGLKKFSRDIHASLSGLADAVATGHYDSAPTFLPSSQAIPDINILSITVNPIHYFIFRVFYDSMVM